MQTPSLWLAIVTCIVTLTPLKSPGETHAEDRFQDFLAASPLPKEESEKVLVSLQLKSYADTEGGGDYRIDYRLHNGLKDRVIVGIIFSVKSKDPSTGKERVLEYQTDCADTLPLHTQSGSVDLLQIYEGKFRDSVITIKEIRTRKIVP